MNFFKFFVAFLFLPLDLALAALPPATLALPKLTPAVPIADALTPAATISGCPVASPTKVVAVPTVLKT